MGSQALGDWPTFGVDRIFYFCLSHFVDFHSKMAQARFESKMRKVKSRELQSGFRSFQGLVILVKFLTHRFPRRCKKVAKPPLTSLLTRRNETSSPVYRNRQVRQATPRRRARSLPCAPSPNDFCCSRFHGTGLGIGPDCPVFLA